MISVNFKGRSGLVLGVANKRSLAWAIAEKMHEAGALLGFTYQNERLRGKIEPLIEEIGGAALFELDVNNDEEMDRVFAAAAKELGGKIDYLVHSIAFAPREDLAGDFVDTSRDGYKTALEVSAYSFIRATHAILPYVPPEGGSVITLSYLAAERVVPKYNVMGSAKAALEHAVRQLAFELGERRIRVNAVSAGPVNTLSARGVSGFTDILGHYRDHAPLRRNIEPEEVGNASVFLLSDLAGGITGITLYVDAGFHIMAV